MSLQAPAVLCSFVCSHTHLSKQYADGTLNSMCSGQPGSSGLNKQTERKCLGNLAPPDHGLAHTSPDHFVQKETCVCAVSSPTEPTGCAQHVSGSSCSAGMGSGRRGAPAKEPRAAPSEGRRRSLQLKERQSQAGLLWRCPPRRTQRPCVTSYPGIPQAQVDTQN